MCTLAIFFRQSTALPLVVAGNRDEFYERPTAPPRVIAHDPWVVAGQDLSEGGTWLGTNEYGMVASILNRRNQDGPDSQRRSRGLLCLEALQAHSPEDVVDRLLRGKADTYNWFNLFIADQRVAWVVSNAGDQFDVSELSPGVHLLTNLKLNDPSCARIVRSRHLFESVELTAPGGNADRLLEDFRNILSDHSLSPDPRMRGPLDTLCIHTPGYGTRSSSALLYVAETGRVRYWHAPGPPCENEFAEVPLPNGRFAGQQAPE